VRIVDLVENTLGDLQQKTHKRAGEVIERPSKRAWTAFIPPWIRETGETATRRDLAPPRGRGGGKRSRGGRRGPPGRGGPSGPYRGRGGRGEHTNSWY